MLFRFSVFPDLFLLVLSVSERGVFKSPTVFIDLFLLLVVESDFASFI
jgi:hypothetical protein